MSQRLLLTMMGALGVAALASLLHGCTFMPVAPEICSQAQLALTHQSILVCRRTYCRSMGGRYIECPEGL